MHVILAGNSLFWSGSKFSWNSSEAKTYASEAAAKRAMKGVGEKTGRKVLKVITQPAKPSTFKTRFGVKSEKITAKRRRAA